MLAKIVIYNNMKRCLLCVYVWNGSQKFSFVIVFTIATTGLGSALLFLQYFVVLT